MLNIPTGFSLVYEKAYQIRTSSCGQAIILL